MLVAFDLLYLNGRDLWVEPKLLAEIEYQAKSAEGKVRHPFFKGCEDLYGAAIGGKIFSAPS
ncbi:hypothetical protein [Bradyrhizobium barranii]